ncbi:MAG: hypothetical protein UR85_C0005G0003 [Candidatus Nomurabacteria bacterium GW2011_GWF2_35_66]|uniref:Uncharacterized protein n=1 Tax=Candidatus Nomurabacteria bacterium GW2011_GWE1_35_16 TaxID=1618761 RepID=A0A0G0BAS5_9BACT|nr:MAG: hypothetical protein UR55_C0006G0004 [Candidatus Nomurabacteria bacterium GW2011_GWF1_34_20]KKP63232.1 MAG: hypothetical protein UR57_C0007G0004 [Candidatus Nomurabacteria bacterium GW2011_GWE2_34_25]KKP66434.1 MAG: hypothetical protein UR64_C0007G0003 [Candidatus Nomurabacteria bacterium GW2011_GWE1_35_16]KKP83328.1 MAG: hypothetical protein UR85_C0005G0003 [Candidatus Nomurabacteria bacterium GW2011_GWF2_35_66]HAE36489.1 hypothetical protein [Candidatus Nomurabacteria bacterium]
MYKKLSRSEEILANLPEIPVDPEEELQKMERMNSYMREVRRDFIYKSAMSERSASEVILNS